MKDNMLDNKRVIKIFKIAIGAAFAIFVASQMNLKYATSAGIITLLTIQDTKKETLKVTLKRLISFLISILIAMILFRLLSYQEITFGLYLFIFIGICYKFGMEDGIAMSAVLTTHFLIEQSTSFYWIKNEILLMIIGILIGILLNLYMPRNIKNIRLDIDQIQLEMKEILAGLYFNLTVGETCDNDDFCKREKGKLNDQSFIHLENTLDQAMSRAYENMNNTFLVDTRYFIAYIELRKNQCQILKEIYKKINYLTIVPKQAYLIADAMKDIENSFHEYNNALDLIEELNLVKSRFREDSLPNTREEFENRAILYGILSDLELFLIIKVEFINDLTKEQIALYWREQKDDNNISKGGNYA